MRKLEELFEKGFYTMAFIRTLICVIFLALSVSCVAPLPLLIGKETSRYNTYLELHSIHWEEGTYCSGCPYPNKFYPVYDSPYFYWNY